MPYNEKTIYIQQSFFRLGDEGASKVAASFGKRIVFHAGNELAEKTATEYRVDMAKVDANKHPAGE